MEASRRSSHASLGTKFSALRLITRWIVGLCAGVLMVAVTSPLFIRSYAPLQFDPIRQTYTLQPGLNYRWRSEGYANTRVGPLGMPGKATLPPSVLGTNGAVQTPNVVWQGPNKFAIHVALWGDSQAEGTSLSDDEKLFAKIQRTYSLKRPSTRSTPDDRATAEVFPLARSGEDAAVWLTQMPLVDNRLMIDAHVILIVDLEDLLTAPQAPLPLVAVSETGSRALASRLPAFVIQAGKHLLLNPDGQTRRRLRFRVGPVQPTSSSRTNSLSESKPEFVDWGAVFRSIRRSTRRPVVVVYAPKAAEIVDGKFADLSVDLEQIPAAQVAASEHNVEFVDLTNQLLDSACRGDWPNGFHNGQIGTGHLNEIGYTLIAGAVADALLAMNLEQRRVKPSRKDNGRQD